MIPTLDPLIAGAPRPTVTFTVNGVAMRLRHGFKISETNNGRTRFDGVVYSPDGSTNRPAVGADIQLVEDGVVIFGGIIDTPTEGGVGGEPVTRLLTPISAMDYNGLAERRVMNVTLAAGTLKSRLAVIAPYLAHWGVVLDPAQVDGPTFTDPLPCSFLRVDDVLNQLTTLTNGEYLWNIDYNKHLQMFSPATTGAPFDVVDGDRHTLGDVTVAPSITSFATRILLLAGDGLHEVTETWTADGTTASFPLGYWVAATRGYVTANPPGHTGPDVNEPLGETAPPYWTFDNSTGLLTRTPTPPAGTAITFIYTAQFPVLVYADPPGGIPDPPGLWEQLVREPDVFDKAIAQAHANSYILQASQQTTTIKYRTLGRGVHPGQLQNIQRSARHLLAQCLITDVAISDTNGRTYRDVTAVAATIPPGETWRDIIKSWMKSPTSASGSFAQISGGGGGGGGGGASITGAVDHLVKIAGANQGVDSTISESGGVVNLNGGSLMGASAITATTLHGAYDAAQLTGTVPDAQLSSNVALLNRATNAFTGAMTIGGTLGVSGASTLASLGVTTNATVGGTLGVTGTTSLSTLATSGLATLASASVTGNASIGGTLGVTGPTTLSTVTSSGLATLASLNVTGNTTMGGALGVTGVVSGSAFKPTPLSAGAPGELFLGNYGLTLWATTGPSFDFGLLQSNGNAILRVPVGTNQLEVGDGLNSIGYVSGTTGWRITSGGAADFRALTSDELKVKTFVVDQNRALAGNEVIAQSVAVVMVDFTMPAYSAAATLTVQDLAGAPGMAVFAVGDAVQLRVWSRSGGALSATDGYGVVSAPATGLPGGTQTWTWTRGDSSGGGGMAAGTIVPTGTAAIDYGLAGSGYLLLAGNDGAYNVNGPYVQVTTWAAPSPAFVTMRARLGNLYGVTSVANEYGLFAGTYAATNGRYFRASNTTFELHGIDLLLWDGATNTVKLDHTTPYFAMGSPRPSAYTDGVAGLWMGKDAGAYKFRVGTPGGSGMAWDGTTLQVVGSITITGGNAAKIDFTNVTAPYAGGYGQGGPATSVSANVTAAAVYGSGLLMGSNYMGYYNTSSGWRTYMDNAGHFYLVGTAAHSLSWDGTTLTLHGNITADNGTFTGTVNASAGTIGGWTISGGNLTATNISMNYSGLIEVGPSSTDQIVLTAFGNTGGDGGTRLWIGNASGTTILLRIRNDGTISSQGLSAGSCSLSGTRFVAPQGATGSGYSFSSDPSTYFGSDTTTRLAIVANGARIFWDSAQMFPEATGAKNLGSPTFAWGTLYTVNVSYTGSLINASDGRLKTRIRPTVFSTELIRALRPVDFEYRDRPGRTYQGFIAQDVAAAAPAFGAITRNAGGEAVGLEYGKFVPALVATIQELLTRIDTLERRIHAQ